jgi:hypothetical protein
MMMMKMMRTKLVSVQFISSHSLKRSRIDAESLIVCFSSSALLTLRLLHNHHFQLIYSVPAKSTNSGFRNDWQTRLDKRKS